MKEFTFSSATELEGGGLVSQRRRRYMRNQQPTSTKSTSAIVDHVFGEDVLSPLIGTSTHRISNPMFIFNASTPRDPSGSICLSSSSIASPYSLKSPPPQINSSRVRQNRHLDDFCQVGYTIRGNHIEESARKKNTIDEDDDSKSKASFLSIASKQLKKKLNAKEGRSSIQQVERQSNQQILNYHIKERSNKVTACANDKVVTKAERRSCRIKEGRDPSPTHDDDDDDDYYSTYRRQQDNHQISRRLNYRKFSRGHCKANNGDDENDTQNDESTLSTNSSPTHTSIPLPIHAHLEQVKSPPKKVEDKTNSFEIHSVWLPTNNKNQELAFRKEQKQQYHGKMEQRNDDRCTQRNQDEPSSSPLSMQDPLMSLAHCTSARTRDVRLSPSANDVLDDNNDDDDEKSGPTTFAEKKEHLMNSLHCSSTQMKYSSRQKNNLQQTIKKHKQPNNVVEKGKFQPLEENTTTQILITPTGDLENIIDRKKRGHNTFAEYKELIGNSLNFESPKQNFHSHQANIASKDSVEREDSSPSGRKERMTKTCVLKKPTERQCKINQSSIVNELRSKFDKNYECSRKYSTRYLETEEQLRTDSSRFLADIEEEKTPTLTKEEESSSVMLDKRRNDAFPHRSGVMAELTAKFEKPRKSRQHDVENVNGTQDGPLKRENMQEVMDDTAMVNHADSIHGFEEKMLIENQSLRSQLQHTKNELSKREEELNDKVAMFEHKLRMQENDMNVLREEKRMKEAKEDARRNEYVDQLTADLESYKAECASYRERILQKEREIAKMENSVYEEKKRVLSLESENQLLLNIAEDNVSNAASNDREIELTAYKQECDKYRKRILELERKVMASQDALDSTGHIATALEEEKKSINTKMALYQADNESLQAKNVSLLSKLDEKNNAIESLENEVSTLKSRWSEAQSNIVDTKEHAHENGKLLCILESENVALMQKLEKYQTIVNRCTQVEEENLTLRKLNNDLTERNVVLSKEALDVQGLVSNINRLQKITQDNESYISKLQDELAKERAAQLEWVQNARQKNSHEITTLREKLQAAEESARIAELKNYDLDEKIVSLENDHSKLRDIDAQFAKSQSDQMLQLMEHSDVLRKRNIECESENTSLKQTLAERMNEHDLREKDLLNELALLEGEKSKLADNLATTERNLIRTRKENTQVIEEFTSLIQQKDDMLGKIETDFANLSLEKTNCVESLSANVQQLELSLKSMTTQKNTFEKQAWAFRKNLTNVFDSMRTEISELHSDVESRLRKDEHAVMKVLEGTAHKFASEIQKHKLENSMKYSVAMSMVSSEKSNLERLLWSEQEKTSNLEVLLDSSREYERTLSDACTKLSISEKESLLDAIDNVLLDSSNAKFQVNTLEIDIANLTSAKTDLEYEIERMTSQLNEGDELIKKLKDDLAKGSDALNVQREENVLLKEKLEMQVIESNRVVEQMRSSFDVDRRSQDKIVDEIIAAKEDALLREQEMSRKVESLTKEATNYDEQVNKLKVVLDELKQERDDIASKYEASRQQASSLLDKLLSAQNKADDLMTHYMKIEDELRQQLQSVQGEKIGLERKLKVVQRESDRLLSEYCTEKHGLTATHASQVEFIQELQSQIDDLTSSITESKENNAHLSKEITELRYYNTELIEKYDCACSERDQSSRALLEENEKRDKDMKAVEQRFDSERAAHASVVTELQSVFNIEREHHVSTIKNLDERICTLTCEVNQLRENSEKLKKSNEDQLRQITQLNISLEKALEESKRLGSIIISEQNTVVQATNTMSSLEEDKINLAQSLQQSQSELGKITKMLGLQEPDLMDIERSLQKFIQEKERLEKDSLDKEAKLFKTMNDLTHFELKLARAEHEREALSESAQSEVVRLQNELISLETNQQLNEAKLKSKILLLEKSFEVESINNQHNEEATKLLNQELSSQRDENKRLSFDNEMLTNANDRLKKENDSQAKKLESIKIKIDCAKSKIAVGNSDDMSMKSNESTLSHVKKTASELQMTAKSIKKHHDETIRKLQSELNDARRRIRKYECKIKELTNLIEENAVVIESLHTKLRRNTSKKSSCTSPRHTFSDESEVTE